MQTGNGGAEFGNANGAVVNMTMKSGTNQFHGNVFEFLQNDKLNANGFIANRGNAKRGAFKRNIFGGTFGGPIRRDKLFFFVDYQGAKDRSEGPALASVAPVAWRSGDLSGLLSKLKLTDPASCDANGKNCSQFAGNIIPTSRIVNPVAKALLPIRSFTLRRINRALER